MIATIIGNHRSTQGILSRLQKVIRDPLHRSGYGIPVHPIASCRANAPQSCCSKIQVLIKPVCDLLFCSFDFQQFLPHLLFLRQLRKPIFVSFQRRHLLLPSIDLIFSFTIYRILFPTQFTGSFFLHN